MTPKALRFVALNLMFPIIEGAWLTEAGTACLGLKDAVKIRYKFKNGSVRTLSKEDVDSMRADGIGMLNWGYGNVGNV